MITNHWLFDVILYLYTLSLLVMLSDLFRRNKRARSLGTGLLGFVWVLQSSYFFVRMFTHQYMPIFTLFETLFFFAWVMVTLSLILDIWFRIEIVHFYINLFGFIILIISIFSDYRLIPSYATWEMADQLLIVHIGIAVGSYAAFTLSAIGSGTYLFLHRKLKARQWSSAMRRIPSLDRVDRYASSCCLIGVVLVIFSLMAGMLWIFLMGNWALIGDAKVISSFVLLVVYVFYVIRRFFYHTELYKLAIWNMAAYLLIIANFLVSEYFSVYHQWVWG